MRTILIIIILFSFSCGKGSKKGTTDNESRRIETVKEVDFERIEKLNNKTAFELSVAIVELTKKIKIDHLIKELDSNFVIKCMDICQIERR